MERDPNEASVLHNFVIAILSDTLRSLHSLSTYDSRKESFEA